MDDTTLISYSKEGIEELINVCHDFFGINDIQANIKKYELLKINSKEDMNNVDGNSRYLGFYLDMTTRKKYILIIPRKLSGKACILIKL